ncbi:MAG: hypothetical protein KF773_37300 [Deltaproteobacteria bacterium]|nr:hypothetical protein [Deltaproteobacteria bacterium]MCW5808997.1 hypothetical protein [Deltaproteobacteria bacterium]
MRLVLLAIALLAGCKSDEVKQLEQVKREICACKDVACGEAAMKKLPQKDQTSEFREQQLAKDIMNCLAKLYDEARPSTDPDQPQPEPGSDGSAAPAP